jgi:hypothetical protein
MRKVYDRPHLMFTRTFQPRQFLRQVYGTEPFSEYVRRRNIHLEQVVGFPMKDADFGRWQAALRVLPEPEQARIELELAQVNELANADAAALLLAAAEKQGLPADTIPAETALALWFFLHHPHLFREVFLRQEIGEVDVWRTASAPPGITLDDLHCRQEALSATLGDFFRLKEGTGRFCAVDAYRLEGAYCFVTYLSARLHLFDVFTDDGRHTTQRARPAFALVFAYSPRDGRLLLKARQRARGRVLDLFQRFGQAVLGVDLDQSCLTPAFRLDLFKRRFAPPLDAPDMVKVRVKSLHLVSPEREGRRRVKLETLAGDSPFAISDLLREHGGSDAALEHLTVCYAELEVQFKTAAGSRTVLVRLWPDRCSLNQTALGERLRACLRRWGVYAG